MGNSQQSAGGLNNGSAFDFTHPDSATSNVQMKQETSDKDAHVLTTFTWTLGGNSVMITGSFTNWTNHIPLRRDGHIFTATVELSRGEHYYKFIVDGEWRFSPQDPTKPDAQGNINNYIDTTNYKGLTKDVESNKSLTSKGISTFNESKKQKALISCAQFNETAPKLPSLLSSCSYLDNKDASFKSRARARKSTRTSSMEIEPNSLNSDMSMDIQNLTRQDIAEMFDSPHSLAPPTHVVLNHAAIKKLDKNYNVYSITHRFKSKNTTYKFYTHQRKGSNQVQI